MDPSSHQQQQSPVPQPPTTPVAPPHQQQHPQQQHMQTPPLPFYPPAQYHPSAVPGAVPVYHPGFPPGQHMPQPPPPYGYGGYPYPPSGYPPNYAQQQMMQQARPPQSPASPATIQKRERKPLLIVDPKTKQEVKVEKVVVPPKEVAPPTPSPPQVAPEVPHPSPRVGPSSAAADEMLAKARAAKLLPSPAIKPTTTPTQLMPEVSLSASPAAVAPTTPAAPAAVSSIAPIDAVPVKRTVWDGAKPASITTLQPSVPPPQPQQQHASSKAPLAKQDSARSKDNARNNKQHQPVQRAPQQSAASIVAGNGPKQQQAERKPRPSASPAATTTEAAKEAPAPAASPAPQVPASNTPPVVTAASLAAKPPAPKQAPVAAAPKQQQPPQAAAAAAPPVVTKSPPPAVVTPPSAVSTPPTAAAIVAAAPPPTVSKTVTPPPTWDAKRALPESVAAPPPIAGKKPSKIVFSREALLELRESPAALLPIAEWPEDRYGFPVAVIRSRNFSSVRSAPPRVGAPPTVDWRNAAPMVQAPTSVFDEPLKLSENAWKRPTTENMDEASQTLKVLRGILNKLTKENAAALTEQVLGLRVISMDLLENMIKEIFSKALREPHFNSVYAQLCRDINERSAGEWPFLNAVERDGKWFWTSTIEADDEHLFGPEGKYVPGAVGYETKQAALDVAKKQTGFKRMLLNNCQQEFEKNSLKDMDDKLREAEAATDVDADTKARTIADLEMQRKKVKQRVLGNIAFIGELFLKKMLSSRIINTCVHHLLGDALSDINEFLKTKTVQVEDIEALHQLFTKVGKEMDTGDGKENINAYFRFFDVLEKSKTLPPRYNFMVLDLIELRQNRWQVRRQTETVSTKEDILAQANNEQFNKSNPRGGGGGRGRDSNAGGGMSRSSHAQTSSRFNQSAPTSHGTAAPKQGAPASRAPPTVAKPAAAAPVASAPVLSPAEAKKKVDFIFKEFNANSEVEYFVDDVRANANTPGLTTEVVRVWLDTYLSKGDAKFLPLLAALVAESKVVPREEVVDALVSASVMLADLAIDIPKAPQNLAQVIKFALESNILTKTQVEAALGEVAKQWKQLNAEDEYSVSGNNESSQALSSALSAALGNDEFNQLLAL